MSKKYNNSDMVFWLSDKKPYFVIEWQEDNGEDAAYWIINAKGESAVAGENELSKTPDTSDICPNCETSMQRGGCDGHFKDEKGCLLRNCR